MLGAVAPRCPPDGPWRWPSTVRGGSPCFSSGSRVLAPIPPQWSLSRPQVLISKARGRERTSEPRETHTPVCLFVCLISPGNRSRSVSGASTGLSSSPLSSPRVRPAPQLRRSKGVKTLEQRLCSRNYNSHEVLRHCLFVPIGPQSQSRMSSWAFPPPVGLGF